MEGGTKLCRTSTQCPKPLMQTGPLIKALRPRLGRGGSHTGSEANSESRVSIFSRGMAMSKDLCRDHGKALASQSACLQHAVKGLLLRSAPPRRPDLRTTGGEGCWLAQTNPESAESSRRPRPGSGYARCSGLRV